MMHDSTYDTDIDYEELEDFWCNLAITKEELEEVDLDNFELDLGGYIYLEYDEPDDDESPVHMIDFED